jgi:hypothetical protein
MQDDPKIAERKRGRQVKKAAEDAAGLTIAERLTRRAKAQTVELTLEDEGGEFGIEMRQPTRAEMDDLQKMRAAIQEEGTQDEANERLCMILDDLCIDSSLDFEFWIAGNYDMIDMIDIVNKLFESLVVRVKEAQTFRED